MQRIEYLTGSVSVALKPGCLCPSAIAPLKCQKLRYTRLYWRSGPSETEQLHGAVFGANRVRVLQPGTGPLDSILKLNLPAGNVVELQNTDAHRCAEKVSILDGRPRDSSSQIRPVAGSALGRCDIKHDCIKSPRTRDLVRSEIQYRVFHCVDRSGRIDQLQKHLLATGMEGKCAPRHLCIQLAIHLRAIRSSDACGHTGEVLCVAGNAASGADEFAAGVLQKRQALLHG